MNDEQTESTVTSKNEGGLWGGRFEGGLDPRMVPLNLSLSVDWRLRSHDIRGSRAWAAALGKAGVLTPDEAETLRSGLDQVAASLERSGSPDGFPDEDIHSLVERLLTEAVGPVGGKLHTGRSRNDQVATDFRLWGMEAVDQLSDLLADLVDTMTSVARGLGDAVMPGYTHLQQAQPVPVPHWLLSRVWPFVRDWKTLQDLRDQIAVLPLGSGAIAGCPFPIDREGLREELGFRTISLNSMDAVSDRDWAARFLFSGALIGVHLSQLSEDLVLFSSREFGFIQLGDGFTTGSSLMPQKKNPDVAELVRGKSGGLIAGVVELLTTMKGLPPGYNRDLQEDKAVVFRTFDTLTLVLPAIEGAIEGMMVNENAVQAALDDQLLATDLADYLVRKGVPFRESHHVVGKVVRLAEQARKGLADLTVEEFQGIHDAFGEDVLEVFNWAGSVASRAAPGGTAPEAQADQLNALGTAIAEMKARG